MCDNLGEDEKCLNQAKVVEPKKTEWIEQYLKTAIGCGPQNRDILGTGFRG